jgi:hypothetical protein
VDWVQIESFRLICPAFADELVWGQPFEGLKTAGEVVGIDEVCEVLPQLIVIVIVVSMDSCLFDGAVHPLDLTIGPRVPGLCQPVINVMVGTSTLKSMAPEQLSVCPHLPDIDRRPASTSWIGELNAIVRENRV